jgi:hypothetical protein
MVTDDQAVEVASHKSKSYYVTVSDYKGVCKLIVKLLTTSPLTWGRKFHLVCLQVKNVYGSSLVDTQSSKSPSIFVEDIYLQH